MDILVSELFDQVEKAKSKEEKIFLLRKYNTTIVKALLHMNYEKIVKFNLPEGIPPYKKEVDKPIGYQHTTLLLELKRFYIWFQNDINIKPIKKESLFIEMLEGLHESEAQIICLVKDKKLTEKYKSLTLDLVTEAYPDMIFQDPIKAEPPKKKTRAKKSTAQLEAT